MRLRNVQYRANVIGGDLTVEVARAEELVFAVLCPFANQFCVPKAKDRLECEIKAKRER
jgi:hypothetical protein